MRWRVTLRGDGTEIRGYFGGSKDDLAQFAKDVRTWAFVSASPAEPDFDPFTCESWLGGGLGCTCGLDDALVEGEQAEVRKLQQERDAWESRAEGAWRELVAEVRKLQQERTHGRAMSEWEDKTLDDPNPDDCWCHEPPDELVICGPIVRRVHLQLERHHRGSI